MWASVLHQPERFYACSLLRRHLVVHVLYKVAVIPAKTNTAEKRLRMRQPYL
jgi:hypothetical protein